MKRSSWIAGAAGLATTLGLMAWAFAPRPVEVEVATVKRGHFEATIDEDGKTRLRDRYVISAPLAGVVTRIALREGDTVKAGDPVAVLTPMLSPMLDDRTLRAQQVRVDIAQANVQRAEARIEGARVALQQARNDASRSEQLARQGFVSSTKLDTDRLASLGAQKDLDAAVQERHVTLHEVEEARAAVAAVTRPGEARAFVLQAPVGGRVLRVTQTSEATVPLGAALVELGDVSRMEIVAELLTTDALRARPGSAVRIERWGGDGALEGRVRLVEPEAFTKVSALGVEEQRVRVLIDLASPPEQWKALGDGYRVSVRIVVQAQDQALMVPVSAVFPRADAAGMAVFLLEHGRARLVPVELSGRNGSDAWLRRGPEAGSAVIVYPPPGVHDGARVRERRV
jgi:HlyD family secretion protein